MDPHETSDRQQRMLRAIVLAQLLGVGALSVLAWLAVRQEGVRPAEDRTNLLLGILALLVLSEAFAYTAVRIWLARQLRRAWGLRMPADDPTADLANPYRIIVVLGSVMTTGCAAFGAIVYLLTGHALGLGVAAIGIALLAAQFPSSDRLRRFVRHITGRTWT